MSEFREPGDIPESPLARVLQQPFLLGLFLPIQDGGWTPSTLPRTTTWAFDYNAALAKRAEELGFDLVFGLAQWTPKGGHGGEIRYREISIDSFMTVAALAPITSRILLISTIHVLYGPWHPMHLAKFGATLDHNFRWTLGRQYRHRPHPARGAHVRYGSAGALQPLRDGGCLHDCYEATLGG